MDKNTTSSNINENTILKNINTSPTLHLPSYINIRKARVGKRIPKNRFNFELDVVESIQWLYKISKETCVINDCEEFKEYQIFEVVFKDKVVKDILTKIQGGIPYPILFKVVCGDNVSYMFSRGKLVLETTVSLIENDTLNIAASSVAKLVFNTVVAMAEVVPKQDEILDDYIARYQEIKRLTKDLASLQRQVDSEKQPKKRIELNELLGKVINELEEIR